MSQFILDLFSSMIRSLKSISSGFTETADSKYLKWKPDFVDVAASGDLGYTYGHYTYSYIDSTGKAAEDKGIFHTVWKRQPDGNWRFVWD